MTFPASQKPFPARAPWQLGPPRGSCTFLQESCLAVHSALRSLCQGTEQLPYASFSYTTFPYTNSGPSVRGRRRKES